MKTKILSVTAVLTALCGGCADTGPNTQQGAVIGGATGAVAGAGIGNNSGSHNSVAGALIGGAVGAAAGAAIGNGLDHQRGTIYNSESEATTQVVVREAPPPPPPPPRQVVRRDVRHDNSAVWVEGHYIYTGDGRYEWEEGRWENPPPRYHTYVQPRWVRRGDGYVYVRGYWR